jgi:hypothetical protein
LDQSAATGAEKNDVVLPAAFVFGKREVIGAWLVWLTVAAACLGSSMLCAADHRWARD